MDARREPSSGLNRDAGIGLGAHNPCVADRHRRAAIGLRFARDAWDSYIVGIDDQQDV